jgi:feruloyl-CoA synthase
VAQDIVITGHDRNDIGLMIFPNLPACRKLAAGLPADAPPAAVLAHAAVRACAMQGMRSLKAAGGGTSTYAARALFLEEPPDIDAGEITDKGYINQRAVLTRRAALAASLYTDGKSANVLEI